MVTSLMTFHEDISQGFPFIQGPAVMRIQGFSRGAVSAGPPAGVRSLQMHRRSHISQWSGVGSSPWSLCGFSRTLVGGTGSATDLVSPGPGRGLACWLLARAGEWVPHVPPCGPHIPVTDRQSQCPAGPQPRGRHSAAHHSRGIGGPWQWHRLCPHWSPGKRPERLKPTRLCLPGQPRPGLGGSLFK